MYAAEYAQLLGVKNAMHEEIRKSQIEEKKSKTDDAGAQRRVSNRAHMEEKLWVSLQSVFILNVHA